MIELKSISLQNIVTYKKAKLILSQSGITIIRGNNLDTSSKNSANRVGKSLLFTALSSLLYDTTPLDSRSNAKAIHTKDSFISLELLNKHSFEITQKFKGPSVGYDIIRNGVNLDYRTKSDAASYIKKIFPVIEPQFFSTVYVSAFREHPLLRGYAPVRRQFFEEIFQLGICDSIRSHFNDKYNAIKDKVVLLDDLNKQASQFTIEEYKPKNTSKLESRISTLKSLLKKYEGLSLQQRRADLVKQNIDTSLKCTPAIIAQLKENLRKAIEDESSYNHKLTNYTKYCEWRSRYKNLKNRLDKLESIKEPDVSINYDVEISKLEDRLDLALKRETLEKELGSRCVKHSLNKILELKSKYKYKCDDTVHNLKAINSIDDDALCPTCLQRVNKQYKDSIVSTLKSNHNTYSYRLKSLIEMEDVATIIEKIKALPNYGSSKSIKVKLQNLAMLRARHLANREAFITKKKLTALLTQLKDGRPSKEIKPDLPKVSSVNLQSTIEKLESQMVYREQYAEYNTEFSLKFLEEKCKRLEEKVLKLSNILQDSNTKAAIHAQQLTQKSKIQARIVDLKHKTRNLPIYKALVDAYGPRGIKVEQLSGLVKAFEKNLNLYASLIFAEPIKFEVLVDTNKFDIIAHRNNSTSDVRLLSGSESRCFILLCLISLLPFIPESKRTNIVVLDELESGMDEVNLNLYLNEFLPRLQSVVPSVFIISPLSPSMVSISGARELLVVKKNNISSIQITN